MDKPQVSQGAARQRAAPRLPGPESRELGLGSTSSESAGKDLSSYAIVSLLSHPTLSEYSYLWPMISLSSHLCSNHRINKKKIGRGDFLKVTA